jgi:hypothetical protein
VPLRFFASRFKRITLNLSAGQTIPVHGDVFGSTVPQTGIVGIPSVQDHPLVNVDFTVSAAARSHMAAVWGFVLGCAVGTPEGSAMGWPDGCAVGRTAGNAAKTHTDKKFHHVLYFISYMAWGNRNKVVDQLSTLALG